MGEGGKGPGQGRKGAVRAPLASSVSAQQKDERRGRRGAGYTGRSHHGASREPRRDAGQAQGGGAGRHSSDEEWNADNYEDEDEDGKG